MQWQLAGERKALALLILGFYTTLFVIVALSMGGAWARCFWGLAAVYGLGFFSLAADYFWARWYALGLGTSGVTMAVIGLITSGWNPALAVWGLMHLLVYLPLLGETMADRYENQSAWRERHGLDDAAVARIKRSVKSAATALPTLVLYTLAPRQDHAHLALLVVAALGVWGLVRMRVWGLGVLAVATVWTAVDAAARLAALEPLAGVGLSVATVGAAAAVFLALAVAPFIIPAWRYLRSGPSGEPRA